MTFSDLGFWESSYTEDGILAKAGYGLFNGDPDYDDEGQLHLDDGGTPNPTFVTFVMGGYFTAKSLVLNPISFAYRLCQDAEHDDCVKASYANVSLQGFRDGAKVAETVFNMASLSGLIAFDAGFSNLSSLVVGFAAPPEKVSNLYGYCDDAPCSHFRIDDVVLEGPAYTPAEVPLPAGLPLLAGGLGAILALAARKRRS